MQVLKSYFKNDNIGGETGFLKFHQKNIQSILGSPYRTNFDAVLNIDYDSPKNQKNIKVHKEMSWENGNFGCFHPFFLRNA